MGLCVSCGAEDQDSVAFCRVCGAEKHEDAFVGQIIDQRYRVVRRLGAGGMGIVYEVMHERLDKRFAMKVIRTRFASDPAFVDRFEREALATSRQKHPNCVAVTDFGRAASGELYLVMEYLEGQTLASFLGTPMSVSESLSIVRQILSALAHSHRAGIVHRDVKPDNIILVNAPPDDVLRVKVLDFGLAAPAQMNTTSDMDENRTLCGTPTYMAPEQVLMGDVDGRSDVYAVGVLLWHLLTGRTLFPNETLESVLARKIHHDPPRLNDIAPGAFSEQLEVLIDQALARNPEERFPNAEAFIERIKLIESARGRGIAEHVHHPAIRWIVEIISRFRSAYRQWYFGQEGTGTRPTWLVRMKDLVSTPSGNWVLMSALAGLVGLTAIAFVIATRRDEQTVRNSGPIGVVIRPDRSVPTLYTRVVDGAQSDDDALNAPAQESLRTRRMTLIRLLISKGACREAAFDAEELTRELPDSALAYHLLGAAQACRGQSQRALESYAHVIRLDPKYKVDSRILEDVGALLSLRNTSSTTRALKWLALRFLVTQMGEASLPYLIGATTNSDPKFRSAAISAVRKLKGADEIDWATVLHLDLGQEADCGRRRRIVRRIGALRERRKALAILRNAYHERRKRRRRRSFKHACIRKDLRVAIRRLERKSLRGRRKSRK